jgi:hypothetical protein
MFNGSYIDSPRVPGACQVCSRNPQIFVVSTALNVRMKRGGWIAEGPEKRKKRASSAKYT